MPRTVWVIAGYGVSRISALKELSVLTTLGIFTKSLKMNRDWLVNKRGEEGFWKGCDIKPVHGKLQAWKFSMMTIGHIKIF